MTENNHENNPINDGTEDLRPLAEINPEATGPDVNPADADDSLTAVTEEHPEVQPQTLHEAADYEAEIAPESPVEAAHAEDNPLDGSAAHAEVEEDAANEPVEHAGAEEDAANEPVEHAGA